jgi:hypothetical protein
MHAQAWALCQMSDVLASILNMHLSVKYQPPEQMHAHGTQSIMLRLDVCIGRLGIVLD